MPEREVSNYEKLCEFWRERFLQMNLQELKEKIPGLREDEESLRITYFGEEYCIGKKDGSIKRLTGTEEIPRERRMNIYNLFWYSKREAGFQDRWGPFRNVKNASPFAPAFEAHVLKPFAMTFSGHLELLHQAAQRLGGKPLPQGDAGYQVDSFACIPMRFLFWDADDEFPAQGNILFDYSVTDYIHVESTVSLAVDGLWRLAREAGLTVKGDTYGM